MKSPLNVSASVRQRLLNRSKADNRSFNESASILCNGAILVPAIYVRSRAALHPQGSTHAPGLELSRVQADHGY